MKNVQITVENGKVQVVADLKQSFGRSKSGKTIIIASTEGQTKVEFEGQTYYLGLTLYRYPNDNEEEESKVRRPNPSMKMVGFMAFLESMKLQEKVPSMPNLQRLYAQVKTRSRSKYTPHQGAQECERRRRRMS